MTAVTRHDIWRALHRATDHADMPVPRYVKDAQCIVAGSAPMLVVRLDYIDEAMAWAEYIGIQSGTTSERPGLIGINYFGDWLGWRVLLLADEQVEVSVEQVAEALVIS